MIHVWEETAIITCLDGPNLMSNLYGVSVMMINNLASVSLTCPRIFGLPNL